MLILGANGGCGALGCLVDAVGYKYKNWYVLLLIVGALPPHLRFFFLFWGRCPQTPLPRSTCAILRWHCPSPHCRGLASTHSFGYPCTYPTCDGLLGIMHMAFAAHVVATPQLQPSCWLRGGQLGFMLFTALRLRPSCWSVPFAAIAALRLRPSVGRVIGCWG